MRGAVIPGGGTPALHGKRDACRYAVGVFSSGNIGSAGLEAALRRIRPLRIGLNWR
jgi:hypothetical protein